MNKMYKIETEASTFAVKVLNPQVMKRPSAYNNHIFAEKIAKLVSSHNINAVTAIEFKSKTIQEIDSKFILIYNWCNGKVFQKNEITLLHCKKLSELLSKIHNLDFSCIQCHNKNKHQIPQKVNWKKYLKLAKKQNVPWLELYKANLKNLHTWNILTIAAHKRLKQLVITHCDMDKKNVLWYKNMPYIIDWESAGYMNPLVELAEHSYCWALEGKFNAKMNASKVKSYMLAYLKHTKEITDDFSDAVNGNLVNKLNWLEYNIKRALCLDSTDKEEQTLGNNISPVAMYRLVRYVNHKDELIKIFNEVSKK